MTTWDGSDRRKKMDEQDVGTQLKLLNQKIDDTILPIVKRHESIIFGDNGSSNGLKIEVDRLKESKKNHEKHAVAAWSAAIGLVIKTFWDVLSK